MAAKTLYLLDALTLTVNPILRLQDGGSAPATATTATEWTNGTVVSARFSPMVAQVTQATGSFGATTLPSATLGFATDKDLYVSPTVYSGDFAAGNWVLTVPLIGSQTNGSVRIRLRIFAFDGTTARELTSSSGIGTTYSVTTTAGTSVVTVALGAVTLTLESIVLKVALETVTAGSNATRKVSIRNGSTGALVTPNWVPIVAAQSFKEAPVGTSATGTVSNAAASTKAVAVGCSSVAAVGLAAVATALVPVGKASTGTVGPAAASTQQVPVGAVSTGTVASGGTTYYTSHTIDATRVNAGPHTNFVFPFDRTLAQFKSVANGGHVTSASGYDILFYSGDGLTQWNHKLLYYDPVSGRVVALIQAPSISTSADIPYRSVYGNAAITTDQSTTATFDSTWAFAQVGFGDGTTLSLVDLTANGNNGTNHGTTAGAGATGTQINFGAAVFSGTAQYISLADAASLRLGTFTISARVKPTDFSQYAGLVSKTGATNPNVSAPYDSYIEQTTGKIVGVVGNDTNAIPVVEVDYSLRTSTGALTAAAFNHIGWRINGAAYDFYIAGANDIAGAINAAAADRGQSVLIGARADFATMLKGSLDILFIANAARSNQWMETEYNAFSSGTAFFSGTTETTVSGGGVTAVTVAQVAVGTSAAATLLTHADSSASASVASSATATIGDAVASTAQVPVTATSATTVSTAADSVSQVPVGATSVATIETHASAAALVPVGSTSTATVAGGVTADSTQQVPIGSASAATIETHADSSLPVPVGTSAAATLLTHADSSQSVPVSAASTATVETHADSSQQVPVGSSATAAIGTSADSSQQVPVGSSSAAIVGTGAASTQQVPVTPSAAAALGVGADGTQSVPVSAAATATIGVQSASNAEVPVGSSADATVLTHADSTQQVPVGAVSEFQIDSTGTARSTKQVPVGAVSEATVGDTAASSVQVPVIPSSTAGVGIDATSSRQVPIGSVSVTAVIVGLASTKPVPVGASATATVLTHASSIKPVVTSGVMTVTILVRAYSVGEASVGGLITAITEVLDPCPPEPPFETGERPDGGSGPATAILTVEAPAATPVAVADRTPAMAVAGVVRLGAEPIVVTIPAGAEPVASGTRPCTPWEN